MRVHPYFEESGITIYHGDCREILPLLDPVALVLSDPPYGTQNLGGGYGRRQLHSVDGRNGRVIANDCDLRLVEAIAPMLYGAVVADGFLVAFCAPRRMLETGSIYSAAGWEFFGHLVWNKGAPGLGYTIRYAHEDLLVFRKGDPPTPERALVSVLYSASDRVDTADRHPHDKPESIWVHIMRLIDGIVLDPTCGGGSVLSAAKRLGRRAIGIEIEEKYCEIAAKRLSQEVLNFEAQP